MRISRFFVDAPLVTATTVALSAEAAHHALHVLRLKAGAEISVFNGEGGEFAATIAAIDKRTVWIDIVRHDDVERESPLAIDLVQAVSRGERMDYAVQKAVELGVRAIWPVLTERGASKLAPAQRAKKQAHWQKVAVSACEQCGRNRVPPVHPPLALIEFLDTPRSGLKLVLDPDSSVTVGQLPRGGAQHIHLLIGPEGGISDVELGKAQRAGYQGLRLGPRVLRTETAAAAALAALQTVWGDLGTART